ncbi:cell envelope integrity protein TolA [Gallibacterium trehalosifermentans]|uniref:Cell envelope integrity protein TolA n=1 Tax=Gallibacterium trehalosifermentans TaxID=516935 RepID=A0ABV6H1P9_9PAST
MQYNQQQKFKKAVLISIFLHILLFMLLFVGSRLEEVRPMGGGEGNGEVLGAIMVDTGVAAQEWGRLQQEKKGNPPSKQAIAEQEREQQSKELAEKERQEAQKAAEEAKEKAEKAAAEAKAKAEKEAKVKAEKAAVEAKAKAEKEAKEKAEKAAAEAKAKAEKEAKEKAEKATAEAKAKAEKEAKEKAEKAAAEAKAKAEKEAKEKAEKAAAEAKAKAKAAAEAKAAAKAKADAEAKAQRLAQQNALDDFLNSGDIGGGSSSKGSNQSRKGSEGSSGGGGAGEGDVVGDQYTAVIKREIQRRWLKDTSFSNKVCTVQIELARDGTILNYHKVSGSDDICTSALSAVARTKKVPAPPSDAVYRKYQKPIIDFKLK